MIAKLVAEGDRRAGYPELISKRCCASITFMAAATTNIRLASRSSFTRRGLEQLKADIEAEYAHVKSTFLDIPKEEIERIDAYFAMPKLRDASQGAAKLAQTRARDAGFSSVGEPEYPWAQGFRSCQRHGLVEARRWRARGCNRRTDASGGRSGQPVWL